MTTQEVVQGLHDYLKFRFFKENRQVNLDLNFFTRHFKDGVRGFFGVIVNDEGELLEDRQNPETFKLYQTYNPSRKITK
jgi:hypothetical protein|tara:strand:+ start:298 stop:534 length:237 start_codon:yes stop_codon:yes gene_type:complete